jgi:hypothetical protein
VLAAHPAPPATVVEDRVLIVPSEDAMYDFLTALNVSGEHPELACSTTGGASFLAGLTEPDADHVHITVTEGDTGVVHCCECAHPGVRAIEWDPNSWSPTYPVLALVTSWPDMVRVAEEDYIDAWWLTPTPPEPQSAPEDVRLSEEERDQILDAILDDRSRAEGYSVLGPGGTDGQTPTVYEAVGRILAARLAAAEQKGREAGARDALAEVQRRLYLNDVGRLSLRIVRDYRSERGL